MTVTITLSTDVMQNTSSSTKIHHPFRSGAVHGVRVQVVLTLNSNHTIDHNTYIAIIIIANFYEGMHFVISFYYELPDRGIPIVMVTVCPYTSVAFTITS